MSTQNAPGPAGNPLLGSLSDLQRQGQVAFYTNNWKKFGDIVRFRAGPLLAHIITHPAHVRHVLETNASNYGRGLGYERTRGILGDGVLTSEGEPWQHNRAMLDPFFDPAAITAYAQETVAAAESMVERWSHETTIDLDQELRRLSIQLIGRAILGIEPGQDHIEETLVKTYQEACDLINRRLTAIVDIPAWAPTPFNRRFARSLESLDRIVFELIRNRRDSGRQGKDILYQLLNVADSNGQHLSDKEIRDQVITFFFAGHETSAQALFWTWYLLARNPDVEQRLEQEIDTTIGARLPVTGDIPKLSSTTRIIQESLRLYPPVWSFPRQAIRDDEIGGYHIPAGSLMALCPFITHRHPAFWDNPLAFVPDRFAPDATAARDPFAFYPFGGGSRACLGRHLVMQETILVLATVARHYRLRSSSDQVIEPTALITLRPSNKLFMHVEQRN